MSTPLPDYVEYGPRETAPPPFISGSGNFLGLILKGEIHAIETLCDKVLNNPFEQPGPPCWQLGPFGFGRRPASEVAYEPFSDAVLLFSGRWEGLVSMPRLGMGTANEDQVSLWVPLKGRNKRTGEERFYMMVPYMFVDNPMSLLNGREDYGYQKSLARFPQSPLDGQKAATVWAFGGEFGKGLVAEWREVMTVEPVPGAPGAGAGQPGGPGVGSVASPAQGVEPFPVARLIDMLKDGVDQVFLKQFRDVGAPTPPQGPGSPGTVPPAVSAPPATPIPPGKACYQHLVHAGVKFEAPKVTLKLEQWRVELKMGAESSHPIAQDLGLEVTTTTPFSFGLRSGLELKSGEVIV